MIGKRLLTSHIRSLTVYLSYRSPSWYAIDKERIVIRGRCRTKQSVAHDGMRHSPAQGQTPSYKQLGRSPDYLSNG